MFNGHVTFFKSPLTPDSTRPAKGQTALPSTWGSSIRNRLVGSYNLAVDRLQFMALDTFVRPVGRSIIPGY